LIQLSQLPDDIQIYFSPGSNFFGKALLKVCWIGSVLFLQMNRFVNQTNGEVVSCRSVKAETFVHLLARNPRTSARLSEL
jgi:hypothetical protein